jgi:hypothetical protein
VRQSIRSLVVKRIVQQIEVVTRSPNNGQPVADMTCST